jgi:hypothetical protein
MFLTNKYVFQFIIHSKKIEKKRKTINNKKEKKKLLGGGGAGKDTLYFGKFLNILKLYIIICMVETLDN